jgi:hypothetical protein
MKAPPGAFMRTDDKAAASALTGLEALLGLVDDIDAALAANQLVVAMAAAQGFQRIADFHRSPVTTRADPRLLCKGGGSMP